MLQSEGMTFSYRTRLLLSFDVTPLQRQFGESGLLGIRFVAL
jgi:hypothetical protein